MNAPVSLKRFACGVCARAFKTEGARSDHARDVHGIEPPATLPAVDQDPTCLECGRVATLVGGEAIYPHRPDLFAKRFWLCECGAYCGCHGVTTRPLGSPAGAETRRARQAAHDLFDRLWQSGRMTRRGAYLWLAEAMQISREECHIGMMTAVQARQVADVCLGLTSKAA